MTSFKPSDVQTGHKHSIVAGQTPDDTKHYGIGKGENGRLAIEWVTGKDETGVLEVPKSWLPPTVSIVAVSCGREHSLFLTSASTVYSCGWGEAGRLGHGNGITELHVPKQVADFRVLHSKVRSDEGGLEQSDS